MIYLQRAARRIETGENMPQTEKRAALPLIYPICRGKYPQEKHLPAKKCGANAHDVAVYMRFSYSRMIYGYPVETF